ncbi:unnamed protein product [Lymnaea stagnalis]|uniref:Nuclear pore complex protein Nup153 n=1 Tax=Lymnaea stagnalis TaxID=6523 RepID=A0AAV2IB50_LYMST
MFKKKADVDKHVSAVLSRKRDEKERNAQGFQIARLYTEVKDYSSAKKYLAGFLSVRETVPQAHQLMGEINEALDKKEEAIENYKKALDLGGFGASNRLLVKKICELYCDLGTDVQRMKFWLEKCETLFPKSDIVYRLKERIAGTVNGHEDDNSKEMENLVVSELINQPTNITLRIKLLNMYMQSGKLEEAYEAAVATDLTTAFVEHLQWFETLETIFKEYIKKFPDSESDSMYNQHLLHILRNVTFLSMGSKEIVECSQALARFDKQLKFVYTLPNNDETWTVFVREMKGQMFFLAGLLLLKRAKAGSIQWQEVNHLAGSCFLASRSVDPLDAQAPWFVTAPHDHSKFYNWWYLQSYDRLSQVGHMLIQLSQSDLVDWSHTVRQQTMTASGHQRVFKALYAPRDMKEQGQSSFFYQAREMVDESGQKEPLTERHMLEIDRVAFQVHLSNLSHLVWLCLQRYSPDMSAQPNYHFNIMENIQYSNKKMEDTGAESLSQLDILVFLLATVRCAASAITENVFLYDDRTGRPTLLPVCLSKPLCTPEQGEWWTAVYKFCTNSVKDDFSKLRRILIRGIETVRLIGSHGMSIPLTAHIARSLDAKIKSVKEAEFGCRCSAAELNALEIRAAFYWEKTKQALEKLQRNQHIPISKNRLFKEAGDQELPPRLIDKFTAETTFALSLVAMNRGQYEAALEGFHNHRSPWAKYHSAQIYKILAEQENNVFSSDETSTKKQALLLKARDCLYDVLDRLSGDKSHKLNALVARDLEDIDTQLQALEYDDKDGSTNSSFHTPSKFPPDIRPSSNTNGMVHSTPRNPIATSAFPDHDTGHTRLNTTEPIRATRDHNVSSTSENADRPRPSPERLDSQIRSLSYSQTSLFKVVLDRNEELIIINGKMMEELRDNNIQLRTVLSENKSLMDELKVSLTENKEMMKQIKNELGTLKTNILTAPPPIQTAPLFMPQMPASAPPRGPFPGFPPPAYGGYMINSPVPPQPPLGAGPQYRPSGLPGSRSSNVGKYRPQSEEDEEEEDDMSNIEREYFENEQSYTQYYTPESQIIQCSQDWAVGGRSGMEGQPPIPIPPLQPRMSIPAPGYFASALRGQSLQYAQNVQTPGQIKPASGLGFFASPAVGGTVTPVVPATVAMTPVAVSTGRVPDSTSSPALLAALTGLKSSITTGTPKIDPAPPATSPAVGSLGAVLSGESRIKSLFQAKAVMEPKKAKGDITILVDTHNNRATILMMGETKEILFHHDINALKVEPSFLASTVIWTGTKVGSVDREKITVNLDSSSLAAQLKEAIQKATALIQIKVSTPQATTAASIFSTTPAPVTVSSQAGNQEAAKPVFGGFTFSTTPTITPVVDKPKVDAPVTTSAKDDKPKPFAGFSLTTSSKPDVKFSLDATADTPKPAKAPTSFTKPTPGAGPKSPGVVAKSPGGGDDDHVEEYEPNIDFKPVIALPELVDKKTGEENETEIFVERCRLFRFDPEIKQWKERGVGEMKILKSKDQVKFRIIMRRDQIFKLCANHFLNSEMRLTPMASSDRAWCYSAMDFSEEEMKAEQLAVKFKTAEKASSFQVVFDDCCRQLKEEKSKVHDGGETAKDKTDAVVSGSEKQFVKTEPSTSGTKSLSEMFKPKAGSWECQGCYIRNNDEVPKCPACGTLKPGGKVAPAASGPPAASAPSATTKSLSEMFKPKVGSWECDGCLVRNNEDVIKCPACGTLKPGAKAEDVSKTVTGGGSFVAGVAAGPPGSGFKFGAASNVMPTTGGFSFTSPASTAPPSSGFKFGTPAASAQTTNTTTAPAIGFNFGTPTTSGKTINAAAAPTGGFIFGAPAQSAQTTTASTAPTGGFKFGTPTTSAQTTTTSTAPTGGFKFGVPTTSALTTTATTAPTGGFKFAIPATSAPTASSTAPAAGFGFKTATSGVVQKADSTSDALIKPSLGAFSTSATAAASFSFFPATTAGSSNIFGTPKTSTTQGSSLDNTPKPNSFLFTSTPIQGKDAAKQAGTSGLLAKLLTSDDSSSETPAKPQAGFNFTMSNKSSAPSTDVTATSTTPGFQFSFTKSPVKTQQGPAVPNSPEVDEHGMYVNKEGDDSHIHFEPVVVLPDKVEVKTGEEEENILFEARGKMYRFVSGEWKEKGVGVVKILEHKETKKTRVLMRRDQVLKICCNHKIEPALNLQPMAKSEGKAWVWYALDFTESEGRMEQLALRFRTVDIANEFKNVFEKCQSKSSPAKPASDEHVPQRQVKKELFEAADDDDDVILVGEDKPTPEQIAKARQFLLPDAFYLYEKKPACPGCLGCHDGEAPPSAPVSKTTVSTKKLKGAQQREYVLISYSFILKSIYLNILRNYNAIFHFNVSKYNKFSETHRTEMPAQPTFGFGNSGNLPDFASLTSDTPADKDGGSFVFGAKTTVDFSSLASKTNAQDFTWKKSDSSAPFKFAGAGQRLFGAGGGGSGGGDHEGEDGDDSGVTPSDDIHFEPVIPLPDLVEVKTGKEDWKALFCQRAKLYKFDTNLSQWKERAIGEMKIMSHNTKTMFRILQRREQVLKVACNHLISVDMELKPMATSETAWCWIATDYTDTEPSVDQFAVKFKNKDIAAEFKEIFQNCQKKLAEPVKSTAVPAMAASKTLRGSVERSLTLDIAEKDIIVPTTHTNVSALGNLWRTMNQVSVTDDSQQEIESASKEDVRGIVETEVMESSYLKKLGDKGNRHHTKALDVSGQDEIVPASYAPLSGQQPQPNHPVCLPLQGSMGNPYHTQMLNVLGQDTIAFTSSTPLGDRGNVYHTRLLDSGLTTDSDLQGHQQEYYEQEEGDANDEEEGYEEDEEEDKILFEKRTTLSSFENGVWKKLGQGTLVVTYNDDLNGNSVHFSLDNGDKLCSHVICREHKITLDRTRHVCEWKPIDYSTDEPIRKHFSAAFSSIPAVEEFVTIFTESQGLAMDSEISENMPSDIEVPEIFSAGEIHH